MTGPDSDLESMRHGPLGYSDPDAPPQQSALPPGMVDIPLSNEMEVEPLPMGGFGTPPLVPQKRSNGGDLFDKENAKKLAPILMMLPVLAKSGGRGAIAAFLSGVMKRRQERQQQGRREDLYNLQERRLEYDQQRGVEQRRQDARRWLTVTLPEAIKGTATTEEREALRQEAKEFGRNFYELPDGLIDSTFAANISRARAASIRKRVEALKDDERERAHTGGLSLLIDGETVAYGDWSPFDTRLIDPTTGERVTVAKKSDTPKPANLTEFESFFQDEFLPAVEEKRAATGNTAPLTRQEKSDLKLQARTRWEEAGRAPRQTSTSPSRASGPGVQAVRQQETRLDEEVEYLLRNQSEATPERWGEIVATYEKLGVNYRARRDSIERRMKREDARGADDDLLSTFDDALGDDTGEVMPAPGRGVGPGPGPVAPRAAALPPVQGRPYQGRKATRRELEAIAQRFGITYEQARKRFVDGGGTPAE